MLSSDRVPKEISLSQAETRIIRFNTRHSIRHARVQHGTYHSYLRTTSHPLPISQERRDVDQNRSNRSSFKCNVKEYL